uniref:Ig-like domain-containing protein n=1 Tax=Xiphophorus maculatus TaxID=8083 RepID=A0A3B5QEM2_XIPMA
VILLIALPLTSEAMFVAAFLNSSPLFHGESVTFTCNMTGGFDSNWLYKFHRNGQHIVAKSDVSNSLQLHLATDLSGRYQCSAYRKDSPGINKQSNNITLSVAGMLTLLSLQQRFETITVRCEISGSQSNEWVYEWSKPISDTLPMNEYRIVTASESSSGNYRCLGRRKQDLYSSTEWSNVRTVTVSGGNKAEIIADRNFSTGGTVTLTCSVPPSSSPSSWTYHWYRDEIASKPLELKSAANGELVASQNGLTRPVVTQQPNWPTVYYGEKVTLRCEIQGQPQDWVFEWISPCGAVPSTQNETLCLGYSCNGHYWCRGRRKKSTYVSSPESVLTVSPSWLTSLSVSPDREQHFTSEPVTLNCGGNSTEWRVMTPSRISPLYSDIYFEEVNRFTTRMRAHSPSTAVYWCESESGEFSNAVNVTTHGGDLILVSPVHPVNEGDSVTLGCKLRSENFTSTVGFFKNDKLIQNAVRGELSIPAVSASDEGFYRCEHSGEVSPQSWVAVKCELLFHAC